MSRNTLSPPKVLPTNVRWGDRGLDEPALLCLAPSFFLNNPPHSLFMRPCSVRAL